ncbi:sigma-54 interaction domain-containing protein [Anaeromicrobium sediminis]|nr:sigma 54-interacting transcriptional regulator [Anaeromicrobium sediminis]
MSELYDHIDAIIIVNKQGIIEYSAMFCPETNRFENEGITGKRLLEIYPTLTKETSSHYRVLKSGEPIVNEKQSLTNFKGESAVLINSTFPMEYNNEIIGTIEASVFSSAHKINSHKSLNDFRSHNALYTLEDIITKDDALLEIKEKLKRISQSNSSVLICGDTGTGKELVAQAIHNYSARNNGPFISQNCSAIPSTLLESTLFGTVKGSYTGAENKKGLFELANDGTLFLDEINSMDIGLQAKILKAIEEKKIRRVGGESFININIRVVSAMNTDPLAAIDDGILRKDLYYRLGVVQINLPPLKDRKKDILLLTDHFIKTYNHQMCKNILGVSEIVKNIFNSYTWPGNVRELRNAIESAFNLCTEEIIPLKDIPEYIIYNNKKEKYFAKDTVQNKSLPELLKNYEKNLILDALSISKNITEAAKKLQITRQSLQYKMDKYNL